LLGYKILRRQGNYLNLYTAHDYWLICQQNTLMRRGKQVCETASCMFCALSRRKPPQIWRYSTQFQNTIKEIDALIAPSNYLKDRITSKIRVGAVTIANFVPTPPDSVAPSAFSNFLIYAGMLEDHKGILLLLKACRQLLRETGLKLVILGDGTLRRRIGELVKEYGLSDVAFPMGWVDRDSFYSLLSDATLLVIPSVWPENAPLAALEALSLGTPIVGSNAGGLPEIISTLSTALIFSWEREDDLSRAVAFSLQNRENLETRARQVYREKFSPESYLRSYSRLVHDLVPDIKEQAIFGPGCSSTEERLSPTVMRTCMRG
jgi:glycosyltransferase involved in cell wall biosynthesis